MENNAKAQGLRPKAQGLVKEQGSRNQGLATAAFRISATALRSLVPLGVVARASAVWPRLLGTSILAPCWMRARTISGAARPDTAACSGVSPLVFVPLMSSPLVSSSAIVATASSGD